MTERGDVKTMCKYLTIVWPAQAIITESLFRHFSMLAETAGYLTEYSPVIKKLNFNVQISDCAVVPHTAMNMARLVHDSDIIAIAINMNNVREAIDTASFFKSVNRERVIIAYGEAIACGSEFFSQQDVFDWVVDGGQFELGIEFGICLASGENWYSLNKSIAQNSVFIDGKVIKFCNDLLLPEVLWGMPQLDLLPMTDYLRIGNGELHITACKGCPFNCEFCNEVYVSTGKLRYRNINQISKYLTEIAPSYGASSVYLDSSTFTYNRDWVIGLCNELINSDKPPIPWKTCTRLDCIDEELITQMGKAGCTRISVGVESISYEIQKRIKKSADLEILEAFSNACYKNGIIPRALLIIGLNSQESSEIDKARTILSDMGIQTRFRVLQDFSFMHNKDEILIGDFDKLNRWLINSPFDDMDINEIRKYEYPLSKNKRNYS